jgi:hypothetical protein
VQGQAILDLQIAQLLTDPIDFQVLSDESNGAVPPGTADRVASLNLQVVAGLAMVDRTASPAAFFSALKVALNQALPADGLMLTLTPRAVDLNAALLTLNNRFTDGVTALALNDPACGGAA